MEAPLQIMFVSVILPVKFRREVSYMVPAGMSGKIKTGSRIKVEFGKKIYPAVVEKVEVRSLAQALALSAKEQSVHTTAGESSGTSAGPGNKIQEISGRTTVRSSWEASQNVGTSPAAETAPEASASTAPGFPIDRSAGFEKTEETGGARETAPATIMAQARPGQAMKSVRFKEILAIKELPPVGENEIRLWHKIAEYYMCTVGEVFKAAYPDRVIRQESVKGRKTTEQFFEAIGKQDLNKEWSDLPEEDEPEMIINPESPAEQEIKAIVTPELLTERENDTETKSLTKGGLERIPEPGLSAVRELKTIITPGSLREQKNSTIPEFPEEGEPEIETASQLSKEWETATTPEEDTYRGREVQNVTPAHPGIKSGPIPNAGSQISSEPDKEPATAPVTEPDSQVSITSGRKVKPAGKGKASKAPVLSPAQEEAFAQIKKSFRDSGKPVLLQGVTGSGKTEIYIRLAMEQIRRGENVLYMVPEIAISKQLQSRLKKVFGERLLTFHSKQTLAEKSRIHKILSGQQGKQKEETAVGPESQEVRPDADRSGNKETANALAAPAAPQKTETGTLQLEPVSRQPDAFPHAVPHTVPVPNDAVMVLGTRSALFLPYGKLGLIIVDEEHDSSYKQTEPAPRYHARDTAIMLAGLCGAQIVLGSATPSFESEYNCSIGRFKKIRLDEKFYGAREPEVEIVDTLRAYKTRQMKGNFSQKLLNEIKAEIARGGQVLVFRNRRSYSPIVECVECGCIPKCPHCNVYLSYHKYNNTLRCHYCEYTVRFNGICPSCGHDALRYKGAGTEKLEEELKSLLPDSRVARFDADVAKSKRAEEQVLKEFARGDTDILVGTQMISKGFDFPNLHLVAVIQADTILGIQDFRGDERALQLLSQLMGRTGRRGKRGKLIIQTSQKDHPVLLQLKKLADRSLTAGFPDAGSGTGFLNTNTREFRDPAQALLAERKEYNFPPYVRMVKIMAKHRDPQKLDDICQRIAGKLATLPCKEFTGPFTPPIDKIRGEWIRCFYIKYARDARLAHNKALLTETLESLRGAASVLPDADPL